MTTTSCPSASPSRTFSPRDIAPTSTTYRLARLLVRQCALNLLKRDQLSGLQVMQEAQSLEVLLQPARPTVSYIRLPAIAMDHPRPARQVSPRPSSTHTFRAHFQKLSSRSTRSSFRTATKWPYISRSFPFASLRFFARCPALGRLAPRCKWKMSFLDSWVIVREVMIRRSRRSFCRE